MDLTRVSVGPLNQVSVLVPSAWSCWTYEGTRFQRDALTNAVYQRLDGWWFPCVTERSEIRAESA